MRSWVIGSGLDCDVVVDSPLVSARHCQLTQIPEGFVLDDLGSTNGTYVDGVRIASPARVTPGESITLGKTLLMPWPSGVVSFVRIGRVEDNDIVVDDPRVSGRHARLIVVVDSETLIEDLGSSNGTFLNSADRRVTRPTRLTETDTLFFGTLAVPATRLLARLKELETVAPEPSPSTSEPRPEPTAARPAIASLEGNRWILAVLAQAPIFAVLIVLIAGRQAAAPVTTAGWPSVGQGIASVTFALALAAIWLGCSIAVGERAAGRSPGRNVGVDSARSFVSFGSRLAILVPVCAVGCALLLAIVYWGSGLKGPRLAMWGVLLLASLVGLFFGLVVSSLIPNWTTAAAVLLVCFVPMIALGGWLWPLSGKSPPIRMLAAAMPSRWAFEGLLLLEFPSHRAPTSPEGSDAKQNRDVVEDCFPANSERMGPKADAMAMGSMLIGLAALAALTSGRSRPAPRSAPNG